MRIRQALLAALALSAPAALAGAELRALLVGIGDYPPDTGFGTLEGPPNDLRAMREWLVTGQGAKSDHVRTLEGRQATAAGIQQAIQSHLVRDGRPDQVALLYFTGHGSQTPDLDGDETDGFDEVLVTHDYRQEDPRTWLTDDLLHRHLSAIPAGHVILMFDCCNAGTATRGIKGGGSAFTWKTRSLAPPDTSFKENGSLPHHVYLAACGDGELARQMPGEHGVMGVFTHVFLETMRSPAALEPLDAFQKALQDLAARKVREVINDKLKQHPRIESARRDFSFTQLLKGSAFASLPPVPPPPDPGSAVLRLTLGTDKDRYLWTEKLTANLQVDQTAHVRVFHVDSQGAVTQLFPNAIQQDTLLPAGQVLQLPPAAPIQGRQYQLALTGPHQGLEALVAVASTRPFTDREARDFSQGLFTALPDSPAQALSRGLEVQPRHGSGRQEGGSARNPVLTGSAIRIFRTSQY